MKTKLLITILTSVAASTLFATESPKVGAAAPDFALTDSNGQKHSLGENKGKYVVLEWFNPECPFVKKHYGSGNMQKLQKEYTGKGVVWMSIDSSAAGKEGNLTPEAAAKKGSEWKINSTFLLDPEGKAGQAYGAKNTPHMFVINPGRQNRLRRRDRQQSHAESRRHSDFDQLRESRARRSDGRQAGEQSGHEALRLFG